MTRIAVWIIVGVAYVLLGSLAPFTLLLGWWEAIPAVALAIALSDRAGSWAEHRRRVSTERQTSQRATVGDRHATSSPAKDTPS